MEWTELAPKLLIQLQGGVEVAEAEDVIKVMGPKIEDDALPGPAAIVVHQDTESESWYPTWNIHALDQFIPVAPNPQKAQKRK